MNAIDQRLERLRQFMRDQHLDACIIPTTDPHQSEYPPEHFRLRAWISGFHGSAGTLVVTADHAGLWTDARYFLEAEEALSETPFVLHRSGLPGSREVPEWLAAELDSGARVGADPRNMAVSTWRDLTSALTARKVTLVPAVRLADAVWPDRPALPEEPVWVLPERSAGVSAEEKLQRVRTQLRDRGAASHIISTLDDIAWLFNLRGSDVAYNPIFLGFLYLTAERSVLFTNEARLTTDARTALRRCRVELQPYDAFDAVLESAEGPVLLDPERSSWMVHEQLSRQGRVIEALQPSTAIKARKNATELSNLREAMIRDGRAMVRFLHWLDGEMAAGASLTEVEAAERLTRLRAEDPAYLSDSFGTISGWAANGAIIHYSAQPETAATLGPRGIYLLDSGGQYLDGTTDITRSVAVGAPTDEEREDFTLVLKGHIALSRLQFPAGTSGRQIDAIARQPLWERQRQYSHGTGHGVGYVLNVHEGPQRIAPRADATALEPGMVLSNEPGLYREGRYGIRIENLVAVQPAGGTEFGEFLSFETLTLCPLDRRLIDPGLLSAEERAWLNDYHARVRAALAPGLEEAELRWLEAATAPIAAE